MTNGTNSFLLAPAVTGEDHSGKVSQAPRHLLPYGIILEEYAVRRSDELRQHAIRLLDLPGASSEAEVWIALRARIEQVNQAYENLEAAKRPCPDKPPADIDALEDTCRKLEYPLKRLLH